jgi:hypothetical protein
MALGVMSYAIRVWYERGAPGGRLGQVTQEMVEMMWTLTEAECPVVIRPRGRARRRRAS